MISRSWIIVFWEQRLEVFSLKKRWKEEENDDDDDDDYEEEDEDEKIK